MWKAGKYQPTAKSSLLTNFNLLKFRYSKVDDIPDTPDVVEGRAFALLVIQAISRHLPQLRIDFEASLQPGQRELSCDEFVDFLSHYLFFREYETCPIFATKARFRAETLRQQRIAASGSSDTDQLMALLQSQCEDERRKQLNGPRKSISSTSFENSNDADEQSDDDNVDVTPEQPTITRPSYGKQPVVTEETLRQQRQDVKFANLHKKRMTIRPIVGREEDVALQTLSRMEHLSPNVLHEQLIRLYRAIDVEDSDGVCWAELSNFLSDAILQADNATGGQDSAATAFHEESPFELNPFVCDRPDHPVLGVKGVTLGRHEVTRASEGLWLVQSRTAADAPTLTSKGGGGANEGGEGGNFKCSIDLHQTRPPNNPSGNLLPHVSKALSNVLEENLTQLEWIPMLDLQVVATAQFPPPSKPSSHKRSDSPERRSPSPTAEFSQSIVQAFDDDTAAVGVPTTGVLAYSSTDLRLRLCEYRLQTGAISCLGAVHVSESFSTMAWSPYWKKLFCCSNAGTMSVWHVNHPLLSARAQALSSSSNNAAYRGAEMIPCFERVQTFHEHKSTICKVLFLPLDGSIVTASLDPRLIVQDLESCATVADLKGAQAGIRDIAYQVEYHMIAACGYEPNVRLWVLHESTRSNSMVLEDRGHSSSTSAQHSLPIIGVHFIPNTPYLTSADSHGLVRIWDLRTLRVVQNLDVELRRLPGHPRDKSIQQLSVVGDSDMLLSSRRYTFLIHPLRASTATQRRSEAETFVAMSYSFASSTVVSSTPSSMQLWDLRSGTLTSVFGSTASTKEEEVTAIAVDAQGRKIIVGFRGGKVRTHSSVNGAVLKTVIVSRSSGVEIVDIKTLQLGGLCIAVDSNGSVTCFADRDEGCQFAVLEACGFRAQAASFTVSSKVFPFMAIAHSKRLVTIFELSHIAGLAPMHHSWFRLGDGDPYELDDDDEKGEADPKLSRADDTDASAAGTNGNRRNAVTVSSSAVKVASSVDIVAMEFCDTWRSLIILESTGELHICQVGPSKDRGIRCTHRCKLMWHVYAQDAIGKIEPHVSPLSEDAQQEHSTLTTLMPSASFGNAEPVSSQLFTPSCMQFVSFHRRHQLVLCDRRGTVVALEMQHFPPPHRRSQYIFDRESIWATSVRVGGPTSLENSIANTPRQTPRQLPLADTETSDYDWADDVVIQSVRVRSGGAAGIAAAPRLPGLERGPITAMMHIPSHGVVCFLPAGSRSVYVISLDGDQYLGEMSLDQRPGIAGQLRSPKVPHFDWGGDSMSLTARSTTSSAPRTSRAEGSPMVRAVEQTISSHLLDDCSAGVEIVLQSLLTVPQASLSVSHASSPRKQNGARNSNSGTELQSLPPRPIVTTTASHFAEKKPLYSPQQNQEKHGSFHAFVETLESVRERLRDRPPSVLETRNSKRSLLQAKSLPTRRMTTPIPQCDCLEQQQQHVEHEASHLIPGQSLRTSAMPTFSTRGVLGEFTSDAKIASRSSSAAIVRTPYARRIPSAARSSSAMMNCEDFLTTSQPGMSGIVRSSHLLVDNHRNLREKHHVGFPLELRRNCHDDKPLAIGQATPTPAQQNALASACVAAITTTTAPAKLRTSQNTLLPSAKEFLEFPSRAATPLPQTVGVSASYLTSRGWQTNAVRIAPSSSVRKTMPSLSTHVVARCNITINKSKHPECKALDNPCSDNKQALALAGRSAAVFQ
jgi:WD40 repeat protein